MSTGRVAARRSLHGLSVVVELSLWRARALARLRPPGRPLGGLILGFGFLWSDLACYAAGVGLGVLLEQIGFGVGHR